MVSTYRKGIQASAVKAIDFLHLTRFKFLGHCTSRGLVGDRDSRVLSRLQLQESEPPSVSGTLVAKALRMVLGDNSETAVDKKPITPRENEDLLTMLQSRWADGAFSDIKVPLAPQNEASSEMM